MTLETRFYHYGTGIGLPYRGLNAVATAVSVSANARDVMRRRRLARELTANSELRNYIPRSKGFAAITPDTLPGTERVLETVRKIISDRRKTSWKMRDVNPVDHLELPEHFRDYPELLEFALSDEMLKIVCGYYGMVPMLKEIGIWVSRKQTKFHNSQYYHLDKPEPQILGIFINAKRNELEQGPTTLLPKDISKRVCKKMRYEARYFRDEGFVPDEYVFQHCEPEDELNIAGDPGTGVFCDTSNCLHYGSRTREGERNQMMIKFMLPHRARKRRSPLFDLVPEPKDELRRLVLCGAEYAEN